MSLPNKLRRLSRYDLKLIATAFFLLCLVRLGLRLLPFNKLMSRHAKVQRWLRRHSAAPGHPVSLKKLIQLTNSATRYMPGGALCLSRALTAQLLMERYGYQPTLCFGVAKTENNALEAHAWLELEDCVILGNISDLDRYQPLPTLSGIVV